MTNRPSFETFKEKALKNEAVRAEYDALEAIFTLKKQMIKARLEAKLSQEDVANLLHTKKSNISRLESPNSKNLPNLSTLMEYAKAVGFNLEINLTRSPLAS
ncbi:helix-turn-helix transcriptional regulator [Sulfuricurvum sp.]|uniref:helix-turn-helix transcriptional regulator n=1 Tax=Sulfuricurvum sp. TaxID=2025608 RepID=UPI00260E3424|nr:helix-turn-helix transcriptional regulator [Sulfuricurvum sp.]MDD2779955.1 helix-turn-helix transcriptional regulator [Sulfuricurvum sp.]